VADEFALLTSLLEHPFLQSLQKQTDRVAIVLFAKYSMHARCSADVLHASCTEEPQFMKVNPSLTAGSGTFQTVSRYCARKKARDHQRRFPEDRAALL
jgi:hypothetical protein